MTLRRAHDQRRLQSRAAHSRPGVYVQHAVAMDTLLKLRVDTERPDVEVEDGFRRALRWFGAVETACSRFDPDSELRRLCAQPCRPVAVSPLLLQAVAFALEVARLTGGAFDPTLGSVQQRRGFTRNYRTGVCESGPMVVDGRRADYRDVAVDLQNGTITLSRPLLLDLGAVAKGLALDLAAREIAGFERWAVEAGGDLAAGGAVSSWRVGIPNPQMPEALLGTIEVREGAVCTSGGYERPAGEAGEHHILDPRSGRSPRSLTSVTVIAPSATVADALATAALVLGPALGLSLLQQQGIDGLLVTAAGDLITTPGFAGGGLAERASEGATVCSRHTIAGCSTTQRRVYASPRSLAPPRS